jgi:hypothetical protein
LEALEGTELCSDLWEGNVMERDHLEGVRIDERLILKLILKKEPERVWSALFWLRIRADGRLM